MTQQRHFCEGCMKEFRQPYGDVFAMKTVYVCENCGVLTTRIAFTPDPGHQGDLQAGTPITH